MSFLKAFTISTVLLLATTIPFSLDTVYAESKAEIRAVVGISSGGYSIKNLSTQSLDFSSVQLDGTTKTVESEFPSFDVVDATGSLSGWKLQLQATPLTNIEDPSNQFPINSLELIEGKQITPIQTNSPVPEITPGSKLIDNGSAVDLLIAEQNEGSGMYSVDFYENSLQLHIPADFLVNSEHNVYSSTITLSIVTGP